MKRFLTLSFCVFALTACETVSSIEMPSISMPEWSSLNPFGSDEAEVSKVDVNTAEPTTITDPLMPLPTTPAPQTENVSALSTEMAEMERLTGSATRFDDRGFEETVIEEIIARVPESDLPVSQEKVAAVNEAIAESMVETPTPDNKPVYAPQEKVVEKAIQETVTNTADKMTEVADTPPPPAPVAPLVEKEIKPVMARPTSAVKTNETAMFSQQDLKLSSAKGCPQVKIMPAARSITYFENELSGSMVARAVINEIKGGCEIVSDGLEIDLDILMHGSISDKGRFEGRKDMESFMTFPYFIAVTTPQGLPVDKKIMATAMRFKPVVNDLHHAEKITQFIPISNVAEAANYTITVGFQLNRKQLEYNRARNLNRVNNMRIAPDLQGNPSRLSPNLLAE